MPGRFIRRLNRFAALVNTQGREERVHVRNSGRLHELLRPGRRVLLDPAATSGRQTRFTLALVRLPSGYVSADAHLPNALVAEALRGRSIPGLAGHRVLRREPPLGRGRADFLLIRGGRQCVLEVKSVTLVQDGVALFPDAPTTRGRRHLTHLIAARRRGLAAAVLFVIQRADVRAFAPNQTADPEFCATLRRAVRAGVRVQALRCHVDPVGVRLAASVPVLLDYRNRQRQPPAWLPARRALQPGGRGLRPGGGQRYRSNRKSLSVLGNGEKG
ncbi:MAG TPA: DNA/RNA nuclease SfsA [Candidatus Methylomirabilis sp.]|nr:DNA/RNA nuclease SfsA [Candidatus Methylomirabilis sp.]